MEMEVLRSQINAIDDQLADLFCQRMALCAQVAEYKKAHNLPILVPEREKAVLDRVWQRSGEELGPYSAQLYRKILELSREYQKEQML